MMIDNGNQLLVSKFYDIFISLIMAVLGYFSPIKGIVHMTLLFFLIDIYYGWRADVKVNGAGFDPSKIWEKTIPRMTLTGVLLISTYMLDQETGQHWVSSHRMVGWLICTLLIISIARNGYIITKWSAIKSVGELLTNKFSSVTGTKTDEKNE